MKENNRYNSQSISLALTRTESHTVSLSEGFWFTAAFVLFLLAGPFAAPVALMAVYQLSSKTLQSNTPPQSL